MASIGKIQLGRKNKRAFFNMSHDVNTTLGYGFYEPTCCMDVIPGTKLDFKSMPGVRLAPLPQPTTGLVTVKNFYHFVPIQEVFEAFDNFQSGTEVASSRGVYTPILANHIGNWHLFAMLLAISKSNFAMVLKSEGDYTLRDLDGVFFNMSFSSNYDLWTGEDAPVHNLFNDVIAQGAGTGAGYEPLKALRAFVDSVDNSLTVLQKYFFHLLDVSGYNKADTSILAHRLSFTNYTNVFSSAYSGDYSSYGYQDYIDFCKNLKADDAFIFQQGRSYENADYMFELPISFDGSNAQLFRAQDIDASASINMTGKKIYIGLHLTPAGKRLFKIFNCIGVNFGTFASVETDKLLAYYKCWFDKFNPGLYITTTRNDDSKLEEVTEVIASVVDTVSATTFTNSCILTNLCCIVIDSANSIYNSDIKLLLINEGCFWHINTKVLLHIEGNTLTNYCILVDKMIERLKETYGKTA